MGHKQAQELKQISALPGPRKPNTVTTFHLNSILSTVKLYSQVGFLPNEDKDSHQQSQAHIITDQQPLDKAGFSF